MACFSPCLFSSTSSFLDKTIFLRGMFIFTILKSILFPTRLSAPPNSCIIERLAGMNASIPISTIKPPLTFLKTLPFIMSPSWWLSTIFCQPWKRLAFSWESTTIPISFSFDSKITSTSSPTLSSSGSVNSDLCTTPSDLYPTSTRISLSVIWMILPFKSCPSLISDMLSSYSFASSSLILFSFFCLNINNSTPLLSILEWLFYRFSQKDAI